MAKFNNICVYCSSSNAVDKSYYDTTEELGTLIGTSGKTLIYGGAKIGLMGALAESVKKSSGKIIGVIPEYLNDAGISYKNCNELIITKDLRERKKIMESLADAFIVLPGGYGTLEEFVEILTLKQLKSHNKPIIIINPNNFYGKLFDFFDNLYLQNFTHSDYRCLYFTAADVKKAWEYLQNYIPLQLKDKWFVS